MAPKNKHLTEPLTIGSMHLPHRVVIGAGVCKFPLGRENGAEAISRSDSAAIVIGSITPEPRMGNSGHTYIGATQGRDYSLNALGLNNPGLAGLTEAIDALHDLRHSTGKPLIVSIAAFSPEEYEQLAIAVHALGVDAIELNVSCPNVWQTGMRKVMPAHTPDVLEKILERVTYKVVGFRGSAKTTLGLKLSPISMLSDRTQEGILQVIDSFDEISYLVASNTLPDQKAEPPDGLNAVAPDGSRLTNGGMGGPRLKPYALELARTLATRYPRKTVIGCGGIQTASDVLDYAEVGCDAFQVVTQVQDHGLPSLSHILGDLHDLTEMDS